MSWLLSQAKIWDGKTTGIFTRNLSSDNNSALNLPVTTLSKTRLFLLAPMMEIPDVADVIARAEDIFKERLVWMKQRNRGADLSERVMSALYEGSWYSLFAHQTQNHVPCWKLT